MYSRGCVKLYGSYFSNESGETSTCYLHYATSVSTPNHVLNNT